MKNYRALIVLATACLILTSCFEDNDDNAISGSQISDFVWKGMNLFYLYKSEIPDLSNDRFSSDAEYGEYLNSFSAPEELFESLIYQRQTVDRFSWIVDDYIALEQEFQGTSGTNGMEFSLFGSPNNLSEGIGVIRLVLPGSPADLNGLKRGDIFYGIDGMRLNDSNISDLLSQQTYTVNLGFYNDKGTSETTDDSIDPLGQDVTISKVEFTENPIYNTEIIDVNGQNVGYIMYNGFIRGSETALNTVFGNFKSNNVQHLVVDLRYNPGGSVNTETFLASMITGQFNGDIFQKLVYNETLQSENIDYLYASSLLDNSPINSLNLSKVYILTTNRSASASEGLINGLKPYIDVVQIGTSTTGKTQASVTLYDSPDFTREGVNPNHSYAMQPLVANGLNVNDESVPPFGLAPTNGFEYEERPLNYGIIGNANEPMLAIALADIENNIGKISRIKGTFQNPILSKKMFDSNELNPREGGMLID